MNSIKVLDVTLRDGGCVNNFDFGQVYMEKILCSIEKSGADYIELGYIDEKHGSEHGRTQYCNEQVISEGLLKNKKPGITYVAMIDYGKFDINNLQDRTEDSIDGIRVAFHKKDWKSFIKSARTIMNKGYKVFVQPMLTMRYKDSELLELISAVNEELPDASGFYIVDTFGEMRGNDVVRLMHLVDHNLIPGMLLGLHSHNNLQLSYSNAMTLLEFPTNRDLMLDSSVMGMGKGAGNLNTELLMEHLNLYYGKEYKIAPLLEIIDQVINVIHKEFYWGYSAEYYLASVNRCTPSYAGHFYNKHMLPIDQVGELLSMIDEEKKISFDKAYAEELYMKFNASKKFDENETVDKLTKEFSNKKIALIAPGKSILANKEKIEEVLAQDNMVSVSLNNFEFETDYILTTRTEIFNEAIEKGENVIVPSSVSRVGGHGVNILNYETWIIKGEKTYDSSSVIALNLLSSMDVEEIILIGFDGFSVNINANYCETELRKPVTEEQASRRNSFYKQFISRISEKTKIRFLTESAYK